MNHTFEQTNLDVLTVSLRRVLEKEGIRCEAELRQLADHMMRDVVLELRAYLASKQHREETATEVTIPQDWWQAVRQRWAPSWWLERHPVKTTKIVTETKVTITKVCPHVPTSKTSRHLSWMMEHPDREEMDSQYRMMRFIRALCKGGEFAYECSPRVSEEAEKSLKSM